MKKIILMACLAVTLFTACDLESSDNGDFDGFWQLTQVDTLATGRSGDMRSEHIFWSVQGTLLKMTTNNNDWLQDGKVNYLPVVCHFRLEQKQLHLTDVMADLRGMSEENPDSIITDPATVAFYGLTQVNETFDVLHLSGDQMTLRNAAYILRFRKY